MDNLIINDYVNINSDNLQCQHLCCAISDKKHKLGVEYKKQWLAQQQEQGHVFRKLNAQGKVFIEYCPIENAWASVQGQNYLYIYCLWVAGSFAKKGYGKQLLEFAVADAKKQGKSGLCTISSKKKKPFVSEKGFFEKHGFVVADKINDFELLVLSFDDKDKPSFAPTAKLNAIEDKRLTIFYSPQCPYTNNCIEEITDYCSQTGTDINIIKVNSLQQAKLVPCVFNNWATFVNGKYYSNILLNKNSFEKLLNSQEVL